MGAGIQFTKFVGLIQEASEIYPAAWDGLSFSSQCKLTVNLIFNISQTKGRKEELLGISGRNVLATVEGYEDNEKKKQL
ncbi:hypothetical protein Gasu2_58630 [Galdieria sulphuraria]|nr:hypothetical protein Gasu2_58630 [Galdieria sulphuraria]